MMKRYLVVFIATLLMVTGLPALAKDHAEHRSYRHDGHHSQAHRGDRRQHWSLNRSHRQGEHHRKHFKHSRHQHHGHGYRHGSSWGKGWHGAKRHHRQHDYRSHRCGHNHRGAYILGGAIAGALVTEYYQSYRY